MAEVSYLRFPETLDPLDQDDIFAFDSSFPFCSLDFTSDPDPASIAHDAAAFDPEIYVRIGGIDSAESGSGSFEEIPDHESQVNSVIDLLKQRVEQSHSNLLEIGSFESVPNFGFDFGMIDRNRGGIGANSFELEEEDPIGLGTIFNRNTDLHRDDNSGEIVSRQEIGNSSGGNSNLIQFASDSEEDVDDLREADIRSDDETHTLCWDSLQLEDPIDANDEFEWEEVDAIEGLSLPVPEEEEHQASRNLEWQVLLNGNNEAFNFGSNEDYTYTAAEYEMTIGQIAEGDNPSICRPPASKLAVESLPSVTMTDEDVHNGNSLCVVCKDEMSVGEEVKQLPCSHRYHGECIVPWLGISNTCPVCRSELPTDDPDYEQRKAQSATRLQ